jgi:hypothetical protein
MLQVSSTALLLCCSAALLPYCSAALLLVLSDEQLHLALDPQENVFVRTAHLLFTASEQVQPRFILKTNILLFISFFLILSFFLCFFLSLARACGAID